MPLPAGTDAAVPVRCTLFDVLTLLCIPPGSYNDEVGQGPAPRRHAWTGKGTECHAPCTYFAAAIHRGLVPDPTQKGQAKSAEEELAEFLLQKEVAEREKAALAAKP